MRKVLIAMSHALTQAQILDLTDNGYEAVVSKEFLKLGCNRLVPTLTSLELAKIARQLINEAEALGCEGVAMTGEPMLTFHVWNLASSSDLFVLQSTTERNTIEKVQDDGSVVKTQVFNHVQWRRL